jgi:hypothetical protein
MNTETNMTDLRAAQTRNAGFYRELNEVTARRQRGEITKDESKAIAKRVHAKYYGKNA